MEHTTNETIEDALLLIEQNFYFLHAGEFFALWSRREDLSAVVPRKLIKDFDGGLSYAFDGGLIGTVLAHEHATPDDATSLFEYFVEFNAFRGIAMGMIEATQSPSPFRDFLHARLGEERFENFIDIVAFVRNVLSHNTHAEIRLTEKDYLGRRKRIERMGRDTDIHFALQYHEDVPEIKGIGEGYGVGLHVDFGALEPETLFLDVMTMGDLMLLSELCFNWVMVYRAATEES
jgi:hypothetical protein